MWLRGLWLCTVFWHSCFFLWHRVGLGLIVWLGVYLHIAWVLAKKPTKKCHASRLMGCFSAVHTLLFGRAHLAFRPSICLRDFCLYCWVICTIFVFRPCTLCFSAVHTWLTYVLISVLTYSLNVALTYVLFCRQSLGLRGRLVVELFVRRWYLTRRCIYCGSCDVWKVYVAADMSWEDAWWNELICVAVHMSCGADMSCG